MTSAKVKIISIVITVGLILIAIFQFGLGGPGTPTPDETTQNQEIMIASTNPSQLKERKEFIIVPTQSLEITFNQPLENLPETRISIEPQADVKYELSADKKTIKIIPNTPFNLGQGYTIFIKAGTKFEGKKEFGRDENYHFSVISYNGV